MNSIDCESRIKDTLTCFSCKGKVNYVELSLLKSILFMITDSCSILAYNMSDNECMTNKSLLWKEKFPSQPLSVHVHPLNNNLMVVFQDMTRCYAFNHSKIIEPLATLNHGKHACLCYSPMGNLIALGTSGMVTFIDSYSFKIVKTVSIVQKYIRIIRFYNRFDMIVQLTNNQLLLVPYFGSVIYLGQL